MQIHIHMLLEMNDIIDLIVLGAVHKRCPQSGGEGGCPRRTRGRGFFRCGHPHFLAQIMVCPHGQGERRVSGVTRVPCARARNIFAPPVNKHL